MFFAVQLITKLPPYILLQKSNFIDVRKYKKLEAEGGNWAKRIQPTQEDGLRGRVGTRLGQGCPPGKTICIIFNYAITFKF